MTLGQKRLVFVEKQAPKRFRSGGQRVTIYHEEDQPGRQGFFSVINDDGKIIYSVLYFINPSNPKFKFCDKALAERDLEEFLREGEYRVAAKQGAW